MKDNNGMYGFLFLTLLVLMMVASWGTPDILDAFIYYLSDGHYKPQLLKCIAAGLKTFAGLTGVGGNINCDVA